MSSAADGIDAPRGMTIRQRLSLIVVAVALPMLLLTVAVVWQLGERESEINRQVLAYAAHSIAHAADAQLGKSVAVAGALAASPALAAGDLAAFRTDAEHALTGLPGAWILVADPDGQVLLNTLVPTGQPLPHLAAGSLDNVARAFETRRIQIGNLAFGPVVKVPVVSVAVPIMRGDAPAYYLAIVTKASFFLDLLTSHRLPEGWLAGIIDRNGLFVARSLDNDTWVGKPSSAGWRAVATREGWFEFTSVEGEQILVANTVSPLSGWAIGTAARKEGIDGLVRRTIASAAVAGLAVTLVAILLATWAARKITTPIEMLERGAEALRRQEPMTAAATGVPEIDSALGAFAQASRQLMANATALRDSEARLKKVLETETVGVMFWDLSTGRMTDANDTFLAMMGYSRQEVEAGELTWQKLTPPDYVEASLAEIVKFQATGRIGPYEKEYLRKDGTTRWLLFAGSSLGNNNCVEFCVDIADRKNAEEALRKFSRIIEQTASTVVVTDPNGVIEYVNPRFVVTTGYTAEEAIGQRPSILKSGHTSPDAYKELWQTIRGGRVWQGEFHNRRKDGTLYWERAIISPVRNAAGEITHFAAIKDDITAQKHAQEALRVAEDQRRTLQAELFHATRLSEIGRMAAALAHELNQPPSAVVTYLGGCRRLLAAGIDDEQRRRKLDDVMEQAGAQAMRAGEIIRRLREFVGTGERERRVEVAESLMHEACNLAITSAKHDGISVTSAIAPAGRVLVDKVQFQQVIINLTRNAIEAMEHSERKELTFALAQIGNHVEVSVSDTGAGIDPGISERLFTPFSTTKGGGMGIGLSVCREIVEAHEGKIWHEPNPDGGTVFRFTLPVVTDVMAA